MPSQPIDKSTHNQHISKKKIHTQKNMRQTKWGHKPASDALSTSSGGQCRVYFAKIVKESLEIWFATRNKLRLIVKAKFVCQNWWTIELCGLSDRSLFAKSHFGAFTSSLYVLGWDCFPGTNEASKYR